MTIQKPQLPFSLRLALLAVVLWAAAACMGCATGRSGFADGGAELPSPVATATPAGTATPSCTPLATPTPAPTPFSLLWVPDTQQLAYYAPEGLECTGAWIADNLESSNILGVLHTGDLVDNGFKQWQWDNLALGLDQFRGKVLFLPIAGNHDLGVKRQAYDAYLEQEFLNDFSDAQKFEGGKMLYQELDAGGLRLLLLGIGYGAIREDGALAWIDEVMRAHADRTCILLLHAYLDENGRRLNSCRLEHDEVIAKYPNIRLVLCGHMRGYCSLTESFDDDGDGTPDRLVTALMYNMQSTQYYRPNGEYYATMRLLRFDPAARSIEVISFSPGREGPLPPLDGFGPLDFVIEDAF